MLSMRKIIVYLSFFIAVFGITSGRDSRKIDLESCLKDGQKPWYHCLSRIDWRRANFPIRPPRLRLPSSRDTYPYNNKSKKLSLIPEPDVLLPAEPEPERLSHQRSSSRRQYVVQSPSESRQFLAWIKVPLRRERIPPSTSPMYEQISVANAATVHVSSSTTTTARPMPKLLLPTPTRPAKYSLNGFVPKPSVVQVKKTVISEPKSKHRYAAQMRQMDLAASNRVTVRLDVMNTLPKRQIPYTSKTKSHYRTPKVGAPGIDYPTYSSIPDTEFQCPLESTTRMYADTETGCQVWHICSGSGGPKYSFICPNKSIFNEAKQTCDWWYRVECSRTKKLRRRYGRET